MYHNCFVVHVLHPIPSWSELSSPSRKILCVKVSNILWHVYFITEEGFLVFMSTFRSNKSMLFCFLEWTKIPLLGYFYFPYLLSFKFQVETISIWKISNWKKPRIYAWDILNVDIIVRFSLFSKMLTSWNQTIKESSSILSEQIFFSFHWRKREILMKSYSWNEGKYLK